ncbi:hypothetical protein AAG906_034645 [Vitis piasezkii]
MKRERQLGRRAWNLLRLVLLWARKGGVFKRSLMMELRLVPKFLKKLGNSRHDSIHYGERELSFDDTPIFHVKMHRPGSMRFKMPHIPCINPQVDFDYDFEFNGDDGGEVGDGEEARKSFLMGGDEEDSGCGGCEEEEGIDVKAEEFIAKFYAQMKLQRQISYLQYNEMLNRGTS